MRWEAPAENVKARDNFGDSGVNGRMLLKWMLEIKSVRMCDWIHLAQGKI
jgi:hypothetical protein